MAHPSDNPQVATNPDGLVDILPALKGEDSSVEGMMPHTENTECSLISPVQQAVQVAQPTGNRWAETKMLLNTIQVLRLRLPKATGSLEVAKE
jgi:phosphoribosylformylglycinamidine (FGAM) synthase-like amidotransferase family enzyme